MKAGTCLVGLLALALTCAGCIAWQAPVRPPGGALYTHYRAPLTPDVAGVKVAARSGTASTMFVRDPLITGQAFAWQDASIEAAAEEGGLTSVHYADYEILAVLGIFGEFTVTAHGE
jgi:hypothetical protein